MSLPSHTPTPQRHELVRDQARACCPDCGGQKAPRLILCHACWKALPGHLSAGFNKARSTEARIEATRGILEHLRQKRIQPELF